MRVTHTQVAIVTGGAQGIGKATATRLLQRGWRVVVADVDREAGAALLREHAEEQNARFVYADVADESHVTLLIQQALAAFGRLDALVNNAGVGSSGVPIDDLALEDWNRVIATNLTSVFLCAKHAAPHLRRARGAIVNIASTRALQSEPDTEPYSASKGGIVALTHALAISLGPQVRVNCISPGWIEVSEWKKPSRRRSPDLRPVDHSQHPVGRVGTPDDIAAMVAFLLSAEAGFITGQNVVVDGGMTRKMIYAE